MKAGEKLWTRDESMLVMNLYSKLTFGRLHARTPEVIDLANIIGRTPGAIAYKLVNFASLDPEQIARGIKGASHTSNLDRQIWGEFYENWDENFIESEKLLAKAKKSTVEKLNKIDLKEILNEGKDVERIVKVRLNQSIFRTLVLANYDNKCCITGIENPELLIASHITPWSKDEKNRLNPINGLLLNALHDKAFENGLIAIDSEYKICVSSKLKVKNDDTLNSLFGIYEGKSIFLPKKFPPSVEFLKHRYDQFKP